MTTLDNKITAKLLSFLIISFLTENLTFRARILSSGPVFTTGAMGRIPITLNSGSSVAGRLKNCLNFWFHGLKAMDFVLDVVKSYMLPFHHTPDSCYSEKQQVSNQAQFIR